MQNKNEQLGSLNIRLYGDTPNDSGGKKVINHVKGSVLLIVGDDKSKNFFSL